MVSPPASGQPQYGQPPTPSPSRAGISSTGHSSPASSTQYGGPQYGQQQPGRHQQYGGQQYVPPPGPAYQQPGYPGLQGVAPAAAGYYGQPPSPSDDRTWAMLAYLLSFVGGVIAPLIVYFVKKDQSPFVRHHAAQSLNLQLTSIIYGMGLLILALVAGAVSHGLGLLLFFVLPARHRLPRVPDHRGRGREPGRAVPDAGLGGPAARALTLGPRCARPG